MADVSLELLTDEDIIDYTKSDNKDRVLTNHKDLNLKFGSQIQPVPGGVYDVEIFGSPYEDRCVCGKIRQTSSEPCPNCGARVFTKEEGLRRFARIELPFYYLNDLRFDIFKELFDQIFDGVKIKLDFQGEDLRRNGYAGRSAKKLGIKVFDTCQFEYSKAKNELTISEFITDESKCSYEGLMAIIEKYFPEHLLSYKRLINRYYLVQPAMMRPFSLVMRGGTKKMNSHKLSIWYSIVIRLCCVEDVKSNPQNYNEVRSQFKTDGERVRYTALLRALLNAGKKQATDLLNTSKKNEARGLYSVRVKNSARCPIVPSTELKVDEIGVPIHLAYEMCREGFINHLIKELNFTKEEAEKSTKEEYGNPELMRLFKEYAEQQVVLANRQPTLHEYSIYALHLRLVEADAISYPLELCGPLNADFDGDTISVILVPEEAREDTLKKMSPRVNKIYKKNLKNIFEFNHETLNGLCVLSEYTPEEPNDLKEPKYYYTDYNQLLKDVEVNGKLAYGTPIVFTGKIGNVDYQSKITTYGRLRLSKILDADIDDIKVGGDPVFKTPYDRISAKSAAKLMSYLYGFEDWIEKANEMQKLALKAVTKAGVVTFDYSTLYVDTDTDTYKEIRKIADSTELTDKQKLVLLTERYNKYLKEIEGKFSSDLKNELDRASRVKLASIIAINAPSLIISGVDEKPIITKGNLLQGFTEDEYKYHAVENRSLQSIKQSGVPLGGYLTRQISFLLNNYKFVEGEDTENPGLLIPRYMATGRTAPNGKVYPEVTRMNDDDLVPVRSIVTKEKGKLTDVTPDLLSKKFLKTSIPEGSAYGLGAGTSFTESTTQGILGLKHGGHERIQDLSGNLYAPKDCELIEDGKWLILKIRGGELKYPRPDNWVNLGKTKFKTGELIGTAYNSTSPIYKLNAVLKLMQAKGGNGVKYFEKDNVIIADAYSYEDGIIHYTENKRGEIEVHIGSTRYSYSPESMYYFPDGTEVKAWQRICSGVANMRQVASDLGDNINGIYNIFRKQYYTLTDGSYLKNGYVDPGSMQEEIVELVFAGLTNVIRSESSNKIEEVDYLGTQNAILNRKSFFTTLSYGWSSRIIGKALKGELNLEGDTMTETVLGLLLNDKLDKV